MNPDRRRQEKAPAGTEAPNKTQLTGNHNSTRSSIVATVLYDHPSFDDVLEYDPRRAKLCISNEAFTYGLPMGPVGLIETGNAMVALGKKLLEREARQCA